MSQRSQDLSSWVAAVEKFGGRQSVATKAKVRDALKRAMFGRSVTLPLSSLLALPPLDINYTMAEVDLPAPMAIDVSWFPGDMRRGTAGQILDLGEGFVRVTWGVPGGTLQTVEVDVALGWRHTFPAAYLRVEYVPNAQGKYYAIPMAQNRDLIVRCQIAPSYGASSGSLQKTVFYPQAIGGLGTATEEIPPFATIAHVRAAVSFAPTWQADVLDRSGNIIFSMFASANTNSWQSSQIHMPWRLPQRAKQLRLVSNGAGTAINKATVIYELGV